MFPIPYPGHVVEHWDHSSRMCCTGAGLTRRGISITSKHADTFSDLRPSALWRGVITSRRVAGCDGGGGGGRRGRRKRRTRKEGWQSPRESSTRTGGDEKPGNLRATEFSRAKPPAATKRYTHAVGADGRQASEPINTPSKNAPARTLRPCPASVFPSSARASTCTRLSDRLDTVLLRSTLFWVCTRVRVCVKERACPL